MMATTIMISTSVKPLPLVIIALAWFSLLNFHPQAMQHRGQQHASGGVAAGKMIQGSASLVPSVIEGYRGWPSEEAAGNPRMPLD